MDNNFEELVEFYNELLEDTRWKQAVRAGQLSGKSIATLRKKNIIPKQKKILRGIETGTKNILKKSGATLTTVDLNNRNVQSQRLKKYGKRSGLSMLKKEKKRPLSLYTTGVGQSFDDPINVRVSNPQDSISKPFHIINKRHEADEAREIARSIRTKKPVPSFRSISTTSRVNKNKFPPRPTGLHGSPDVLAKERKITDFLKNAYGKNTESHKAAKKLQNLRKRTVVLNLPEKPTEHDLAGSKKLINKFKKKANKFSRAYSKKIYGENLSNIINNFLLKEVSI